MIDLTVKTLDSQNHAFSLEDDQITVRGFKEYIAEAVSVPADSQRLIYCGRVLQDDKKLNDYDINGKVIHLVQRAPPQPGQRGNDSGQSQGQNHGGQGWQNPQRTHYRLTRAQMHGNTMFLGAMSVPAEIVEEHVLPVPQLSNSLSNSRLLLARRMLQRANELVERLADPNYPLNPPSSESNQPPLTQVVQVHSQQLETEHYIFSNNEGRSNGGTRLTEAAAAAFAAAFSAAGANVRLYRGNSEDSVETASPNDTNEENQSDAQQSQQSQQSQPSPPSQPSQPSQSEQQGSTSTSEGQSNRRPTTQFPRPPQMAELLEQLMNTQDSLRPFLERYRALMLADRALPQGSGPGSVEESQRIVDGVSESLHYLSHACHALSDIIVDMGQQPPRNLRCRPIIIQQSAIMHSDGPIRVEAHISVHGRNGNNNNASEENSDTASTAAQSESNDANTEESNQQPEPETGPAQQQAEQQQDQEPTQSPFGTVFNLPNNVEVLMEVSPEGNIDTASGSEQSQSGENNNNNNNNNGGRIGGVAGAFPWGSAPPSDFIRNIMQAVAGHMVQGGITTTTITSQNPPAAGQQTVSSLDGNTNAGQSTQARSNVGTHPTTATHTRSTSRPHVFHQQAHPLGVGMSIGQGLDFDPLLPCHSHHVQRRMANTASRTVTSTSQGTRTNQASTTETQTPAQTATTSSTTTSNTSSTNTTGNININSNSPDLAETLDLAMRLLLVSNPNLNIGMVVDRSLGFSQARPNGPTVADALHPFTSLFDLQNPGNEGNFLVNLTVLVLQNMTLEDMMRFRSGQWEPMSRQRRPLQEFFQNNFPNTTPEEMQEQAAQQLLSQLRPHLQSLLATEEDSSGRSGSRVIDICATVEALLQRHITNILQLLFNSDISDSTFGQEIFTTLCHLERQLCAVLRYSIRGGQAGLEAIVTRFMTERFEDSHPCLRLFVEDVFIPPYRNVTQPPDSEILPLLIYKNVPSSQPSVVPSDSAHQPSQAQTEAEPVEAEVVEEITPVEVTPADDGEEVPETFPGHEALPSDWVPIIARDGVRQRRQLQTQGMTNGGVATFSDAYLGTLPTKRRKLIEQQKPRLLVSPTPNHSAITASMERLVREGVNRAGVEEVDGAAVAVAVDPGVRRAFGQAIRDCLNPRRYGTPDFPDPLRFPNATKYFSDQDRPPK
ncbi:PREDICTED: large proline-rich protein BAG6 [Dufourea novaeangliae]|uniref:large proline-rich protein BAG6 n=1 Tax=Dufourea novaeangliae TaxID=178035 RepID=UPI0007673637|nr:PREDICTED: large proline-rich protein BAG6 [Dufourea novaeangliae]XP_015436716.1 PREDICTED: large proline-rich protein BAG6 [Dufourea novaeangliae]